MTRAAETCSRRTNSLERYARGPAGYARKALEKPTARKVFEALLEGAVASPIKPQNPGGCLMVLGALACGKSATNVRDELASRRAADEAGTGDAFGAQSRRVRGSGYPHRDTTSAWDAIDKLTRPNIDEAMIVPMVSGNAAAQFGVKLARHFDA